MSIGRVSNNQLTNQLIFQIKSRLGDQERLFQQISTNKQILKPSDNPVGTSTAMNLRDQINRLNDYDAAIKGADTWTNVSSAALDSAIQTWRRVNEIGISAADGTKTAADREGMAEELEQLLQGLVQTSNTTQGGRYIFSGAKADAPAFASETDPNTGRITGVFYQGDSHIREITTKDGGSVSVNLVGSNGGNPDVRGVFADSISGVDAFKTLIELRDKLLNNDTIGLSGAGGTLERVDQAARTLTAAQVRLGGTQQVLELDKNRNIAENSAIEQSLSDVEKADTAKLILELNNIQNVYEAALAAGGRIMQTSLLNFI